MIQQCKQCQAEFEVTDDDLVFYTVFGWNENLIHKKVQIGK